MTTPNISRFSRVIFVSWYRLDGSRGVCRVWPKRDDKEKMNNSAMVRRWFVKWNEDTDRFISTTSNPFQLFE